MDRVISPDNMDDELFGKHMTHRHADSLGGLEALSFPPHGGGLALMWRSFHRRLHEVRIDIPHEHEPFHPVSRAS